ncbi:unnamed protein product [Pylaiella littoralis]
MLALRRCRLRGAMRATKPPCVACRGLAAASAKAAPSAARLDPRSSSDYDDPPFDKLLVANRGEIACRVMRTARRMGVRTVAVFSDADDQAPHVRMADEAVYIGPPEALKSYLDADKILDAALRTGAQAIHPGYGFLSENASFAEACEHAGIKFVGPPSGAIERMGDKIASKKIAADAGVHTIPGFKGVIKSADEAVKIAEEIGYPVMIKASAGGGGKGMRIAYNAEDARSGFERSTAEAVSSFGDGRMLVEKYIEEGHHIEIQAREREREKERERERERGERDHFVLADSHGNVAAFPERECSVQRRNQKVLEESPSCLITPEVRLAMQEQAIMLSRATGYRSAGTVEMICAKDLSFYFLEMNTRLQVEHPVTECVTGVDLVEQMLNIAAGRPMSDHLINQPHVPFHRHAIEARVYAEDPFRKFLPSTGPLVTYREPKVTAIDDDGGSGSGGGGGGGGGEGGVRVDSGVVEGSEVSMFYDPMISKLIAHGGTREVALGRLGSALDEYVIQGLRHNVPFLRDVVRNRDFSEGKYSTSFIDKHYPDGFSGVVLSEGEEVQLAAVAAAVQWICRDVETSVGPSSGITRPLEECIVTLGGFGGRVFEVAPSGALETADAAAAAAAAGGGAPLALTVTPEQGDPVGLTVDDLAWSVGIPLIRVTVDGDRQVLQYLGASGEGYNLVMAGSHQHVIVRSRRQQELSSHMPPPAFVDHSRSLRCPMPGQVVSLSVKEGDRVEENQQLAVIEAMKMQNVLKAERSGVISSVLCKAGDTLLVDAVIMEFDFV